MTPNAETAPLPAEIAEPAGASVGHAGPPPAFAGLEQGSEPGPPAAPRRIDRHYVAHEIFHLLHLEKGFLYTARELLLRPGASIRAFVGPERERHMKPVAFLIFSSLLFTLVSHVFHVDETYNAQVKLSFGKSSINGIMAWVQTHYGYANILSAVFYALSVRLFFRRQPYNFFEVMVLLCFVMGQGMLLLAVSAGLVGLVGERAYSIGLVVMGFGYPTWAIGQFFGPKRVGSYVRAFFAYALGYVLFYAAIVVVGLAADGVLKLLHG